MALKIVQVSPAALDVPGTALEQEQISWSAELTSQLGGQEMNKTDITPWPLTQEARRGKPRREREGPRPRRRVQRRVQGRGGAASLSMWSGKAWQSKRVAFAQVDQVRVSQAEGSAGVKAGLVAAGVRGQGRAGEASEGGRQRTRLLLGVKSEPRGSFGGSLGSPRDALAVGLRADRPGMRSRDRA